MPCLLACFQWVKLASFMCQLALPIKKTNYHHVQEQRNCAFCCSSPRDFLAKRFTYSVLVNDVDNGHQATLQGTGRGLGNATSLYESLERLQAEKFMRYVSN